MRGKIGDRADPAFALPPRFAIFERRRVAMAVAAWKAGNGALVPGYGDHSVIVEDPGGAARLQRVGYLVTETFGLVADLVLDRRDPITTELCAACDLIALHPGPLQFEASLMAPGVACILLRGVALPLAGGTQVQIVLTWREVLNRAATARLRRDLTAALQDLRPNPTGFDPFCADTVPKSRR